MKLKDVYDIKSLLEYLIDNLDWPIDLDYIEDEEDILYEYDLDELGINHNVCDNILSLRQVRPLEDNQPWGIFMIDIDKNRIPIIALRKILAKLVPHNRETNHAVFEKSNLLFICFTGNGDDKTVAFVHFSDHHEKLARMSTIYYQPKKEVNFNFEEDLQKLQWRRNNETTDEWIKRWQGAFTRYHQQNIKESKVLVKALADYAISTKNYILDVYKIESSKGFIHSLYQKFKDNLLHDLSIDEFADMYAQTITYGLFSAKCMSDCDLDLKQIQSFIPNTNPFIRDLLESCLNNLDVKSRSIDELNIVEILELLNNVDMSAILRDFNRQTGGGKEDPVIYFYEGFLTEYENEQKKRRGVYYTPLPVVDFMVNCLDSILKNVFMYEEGLMDTSNRKVKILRESKKKNSQGLTFDVEESIDVPAIQLLDPATGTGTFICQVVRKIKKQFDLKNRNLDESTRVLMWNDYVEKHLLPRLNGFELMMAPYAVAHMKLALLLKETGYKFQSDQRINIMLTNSLEKPGATVYNLFDSFLAKESISANNIKKNKAINIVLGNPPYNVSSVNKNQWIVDMIQNYKEGLNERKLNLDDDYIKFIRFAQHIVEESGQGIVCYITNNSFIDGITHRQMRKSLLDSFNQIYILDLHGNVMKKEKALDGSKDENVFDIAQGVSICILIKKPGLDRAVYSYDLYGTREYKYQFLSQNTLDTILWEKVSSTEPNYFFINTNNSSGTTYESGFSVRDLFINSISGIQTKCDKLSIHFNKHSLTEVVDNFENLTIEDLKNTYSFIGDSAGWSFERAKSDLINNEYKIIKYCYRPFDIRYTVYTGKSSGFLGRPRHDIMKNIAYHGNIGLCLMRQFFQDTTYNHVFVSKYCIDERTLYSNRGGTYFFPLYIYDEQETNRRKYNFNANIVEKIQECIGMILTDAERMDNNKFQGEDLIAYIYAILHSNEYRKLYNDFLKYDFPKIIYPVNKEMFVQLVILGKELMDNHLNENRLVDEESIKEILLESYTYNKNKKQIILNKEYIYDEVEDDIWNYEIGGYKPLQKWLKDRKGLSVSTRIFDEYENIIKIIIKTKSISEKIDYILEPILT
ncbi:type ISP restriction/modification enzyme [Turicibacter sanguinis]|uniref:type ISP restriction/modification enzyme n=1 Tax=Turicibacter sanguinis TaxID=154288 RepID=UPI0021D4EB1A|nr:type ISP restriction/modification enzyme [Turicibacter sanguinis]MCU7192159.1 N-6 DNA methylase [Turicibacter sanguinis]